jgi:hypothetical protein
MRETTDDGRWIGRERKRTRTRERSACFFRVDKRCHWIREEERRESVVDSILVHLRVEEERREDATVLAINVLDVGSRVFG